MTVACLPLLAFEVVGDSARSDAAGTETSSDSSLVVATQESIAADLVDPSSVEIDAPTTTEPVAVVPAAVGSAPSVAPATVAPAPQVAPTTTTTVRPPVGQSDAEFLACVRFRESRGDYTASDPTGTFLGAYQIYQGGWDSVAASIGRSDLVGVPPNQATPADQDAIAAAMLARSGRAPWGGACR